MARILRGLGLEFPRPIACVLACCLLVSLAGSTSAATINCPGANNVDTDPPTTVLCNVVGSGTITDLNVVIVTTEPWSDNLTIDLIHNGISVTLIQGDNDTFSSIIDATFDDAASGPPPDSGSAIGTFQPEGPGTLADFNGLPLAGLWELSILDGDAPGDGTDLVTWNLVVPTSTSESVPEPATVLLLGAGLAGLGGLRAWRRR